MTQNNQDHDKKDLAAAWAVHAFTASGVVMGFLALIAILKDDKLGAFMWLGMALFVDGIDGTLARRVRVSEVTPQVDGSSLDLVIDYFTYVVVPALMIYWFELVPPGWELVAAATVMAVSLYTFANTGMKTHDYYFAGFPALWNLVVLYFHVLQTNHWANLVVLAICAVLTFIPVKFVHPLRVRMWRHITLPMTVLWAATSFRLVLISPEVNKAQEASPLVFWLWMLASAYFAAISIYRTFWPEPQEKNLT